MDHFHKVNVFGKQCMCSNKFFHNKIQGVHVCIMSDAVHFLVTINHLTILSQSMFGI